MNVYSIMHMTIQCPRDKTLGGLQAKLSELSGILIQWFSDNYMQTNPSKFQYILFGEGGKEHESNVLPKKSEGISLKSVNCVRLLSVDVDRSLSFKGPFEKFVIKPVGS